MPRAAVPVEEDYNQWKRALGTPTATPAEHVSAQPGFTVDLVRSARPGEGSWVALAFDPTGRLWLAREEGGLLKLDVPAPGASPAPDLSRPELQHTNLLECRGLLFAHGALYVNANNSKALYRLRDRDGDGRFEEETLLRTTPGGVGHGRNQLALGPDGWVYSIHGDDVGLPVEGVAAGSPYRVGPEDRLGPCAWDRHLFNAGAKLPYGHVIRTDPDGRTWELVAGGLRNPFGLDFNPAGELFTYDADMEWDVGLPWYHPTRVLHVVPGGDYGWRRGTGVLPDWSPDTLPSVVDLGLGSPTGVKFGTGSRFPEPWRNALYVLDWAYGKVHAVHLERTGASWSGRAEVFLQGRPLNVTGIDFGPDGAMYVITGGRRTQSGLYRVRWTGAPVSAPAARTPRPLPRTEPGSRWERLNDADRWVRYAARVELEGQPVESWRERALNEDRPRAALTALLALSRAEAVPQSPALLPRLDHWATRVTNADDQLVLLRALAIHLARNGRPEPAAVNGLLARWDARYPAGDARVNQALCELLVFLDSTNVVRQTLALLERASAQEEALQYLFLLRQAKSGWTPALRRAYFEGIGRARRDYRGGIALPTALNYIRAEAEAALAPSERAGVADVLASLDRPVGTTPPPATNRPFVRAWTLADFPGDLGATLRAGRDPARGRGVFIAAGCAQCHRVGTEGGQVGPDLTGVGGRFDGRALLESILEPSRVIAEVYRNVTVTTKQGVIVEGRVVAETDTTVTLATNPVDPGARRRVARADIESRRDSSLSSMPEGLLNTFERTEILDLLAWLAGAPAR